MMASRTKHKARFNMGVPWLLIINVNRVRFGAAHLARSFGWAMTDLLLAWHLHTVVGLSGAATSALMMVLLLIGALANIVVGYGLASVRTVASSYLRLQLLGAVMTAVTLAAQFLLREPTAVVATAVLFRLAFAMQDVPQSALGSLLAIDDEDANGYARLRVTLSGCSRIAAILLHLLLLRIGSPSWAMVALSMIGGSLVLSSVGLFGVRFPPVVMNPVERLRASSLPNGLPRLLCAFAISAALLPTVNRLLIFTPATDASVQDIGSWLLAVFYCGAVAGPVVQRRISAGRNERLVWVMTIASAAISGILLVGATSYVFIVAAAVHGAALSMIGANLWAGAARIAMADAHSGPRRDGLVAGAVILTTHLSMALGSLMLAPLIEGYEAADPRAAFSATLVVCVGALAIMPLVVRQRTAPATA